MRWGWTILFILLTATTAAHAYIEDKELGETEATAGEQHSNLYKLNVRGDLIVKRLKKLDDYVARSEASGKGVSASDFDDLLLSEKEDRVKQDVKRILTDVVKKTSDPKKLREEPAPETYVNLSEQSVADIRDSETARRLRNNLRIGGGK
ncbi:MAG: hypothetical protein J6039_02465 [Alphaproteobacteria bacterium]|nr:hypothetical protein [Alphaproteobacteria bacterium]